MDIRRRHWLAGASLVALGPRRCFAGQGHGADADADADAHAAMSAAPPATDPAGSRAAPPAGEPPPPRDVGPGRKFDGSGQAQRWPGCTLICHIPRPSAAFDVLCEVRDLLRSRAAHRRKLTWMPEQSYHSTVCDLFNVGDLGRRADVPASLPVDASLASSSARIAELLRGFELNELPPYRLVLDPTLMHEAFMSGNDPRAFVPWVPIDAAERRRLYGLRDRVFEAIGVHHAGQADYGFHTTLAYPVEWFSPAEAEAWQRDYRRAMRHLAQRLPVLELGAPEFCRFENMFLFEREFFLGAHGAV